MDRMSRDGEKGGGRIQTMAEWVKLAGCMQTRVGFVVRCVRECAR
jgi:hypothetical protein